MKPWLRDLGDLAEELKRRICECSRILCLAKVKNSAKAMLKAQSSDLAGSLQSQRCGGYRDSDNDAAEHMSQEGDQDCNNLGSAFGGTDIPVSDRSCGDERPIKAIEP